MNITFALAVAALAVLPALAQQAATPNPLLSLSPLPLNYPQFDKIQDSDFAPALDLGMAQQRQEVEAIVNNPAEPSFDNTIVAMERSGRLLGRTNTLLMNLLAADSNSARRKLQADYAAKLAGHRDAVALNRKLFVRVDALYHKRDELGLDAEGVRLIERQHRNLLRAGAQLNEPRKARMRAINAELAPLAARFTQDVLAEVNDSAIVVDMAAELAGLSDGQIAVAAAAAKARQLDGKYVIALLNTTGQPVLAQLHNRGLRERIYKASIARGSRGNAFDTTAVVARTVALRAERARLLGFATHADYVLKVETASSAEAVNGMLRQLAPAAVASARREGAELQAMIEREHSAKQQPGFTLAAWDWAFYSEKLRAERHGFDEAQLKPYLELNNVLENGVFYAAGQLYGLTFKQRRDLPVYHPDVTVYDVFNADGSQLAIFIADMYARPGKHGGAWATAYVEQSGLLGQRPVIGNYLNIPKPADGMPTLLSWEEVILLFHEFGHALHAMFSTVRYPSLGDVPRDFVEYPSQVNEMWADWPGVLANYARHHKTLDPMPRALLDKLNAAKQFNQGFAMTEYLGAALLDQRWHQLTGEQVPAGDVAMAFEARVLKEEGFDYDAVRPRYRTPYFSHFMDGYAASYYAYTWSEVLDANTVDWFKANGGLTRGNGDAFRAKLLSKGGSQDAMTMFRSVVGHEPRIEPLLQRRGMVLTSAKK